MKKLETEVIGILKRNRDGSFATQSNRQRILLLCCSQLRTLGYKSSKLSLRDLKGRHINALIKHWRSENISIGTIKNRLSALRWLCEKTGDKGLIKSNEALGLENRQYVTNEDKAICLEQADLSVLSPLVRLSVELQQHFGLRREEAMKFQIGYALFGHSPQNAEIIKIKPSWTKGGRYREIPITNDAQRALLARISDFVGQVGLTSLIPNESRYKEHMKRFEAETSQAGIGRTHGLRHLYAQSRYKELMGIDCPAVNPNLKLTKEQKAKDKEVRLIISHELGHGRISVTGIYLGSWNLKK